MPEPATTEQSARIRREIAATHRRIATLAPWLDAILCAFTACFMSAILFAGEIASKPMTARGFALAIIELQGPLVDRSLFERMFDDRVLVDGAPVTGGGRTEATLSYTDAPRDTAWPTARVVTVGLSEVDRPVVITYELGLTAEAPAWLDLSKTPGRHGLRAVVRLSGSAVHSDLSSAVRDAVLRFVPITDDAWHMELLIDPANDDANRAFVSGLEVQESGS